MKAITETGKNITIDDKYEIKRGGEGKILTIPELPDQVAKIYLNKNYQHFGKAQKDALSVLDAKYFVKPLELIYSAGNQSEVLGFTMEYLGTDFVPLAALFTKNYCTAQNIDEQFKLDIAQKLLLGVQSAHQNQIIIGDLSGLNILINLKKEVKFLDVDSYESPIHTHWGVLFDEIRDYLYNGLVSKESDYFALSVLIFNLFCYIHPFKGVHKKVKSMAERMILRLPVFIQDPDLIVPKCYIPLTDRHLQNQFEQLYFEGKRFLLQLTSQTVLTTQGVPAIQAVQILTTLKIKEIYQLEQGEFIQKAYFNQGLGFVQTNRKILILDCSNHGYTLLKVQLTYGQLPEQINQKAKFWVGEHHIFVMSERHLWLWQADNSWLKISNFSFSENARFQQIDNILVVLDGEFMRYLYLDEVIKDQIRIEQTPVFTPGFDVFNGLIQNTGGVQYVFYHSGKNISTVKSTLPLQAVKIIANVGLACFEENIGGETTLRYQYFNLLNLQMQVSQERVHSLKNFAYKAQNATAGIILEAIDDKLLIRKSADFQVVQEAECNILTDETNLFSTQAGIVAWEKDFCYLLNSQ